MVNTSKRFSPNRIANWLGICWRDNPELVELIPSLWEELSDLDPYTNVRMRRQAMYAWAKGNDLSGWLVERSVYDGARILARTSSVPFKLRVRARDRYRCGYCGENGYTIDHIIPLSKGGPVYTMGNAVVACSRCNVKKQDMSVEEAGMSLLWQPYHLHTLHDQRGKLYR